MIRRRGLRAGIAVFSLILACCAGLPAARMPAPVPTSPWSQWIDVQEIRVHYVDTDPRGAADALLIVHGFLGSTVPFEPFIDRIRPGRRVVMPDLPGCGLSSPPAGDASLELYLDFLEQFSAKLGLQRIVLMGTSLGAQLGVRYALEHSGQVRSLVLSCPFGLAEQQNRTRMARCEPILRLAAPWVTRARVRRELLNAVADDSLIDSRYLESCWAPLQTAAGRRVASQLLSRIAVRHPLDPLLARLSLPVLILFGDKDPMNPPLSCARYKKLVPEARIMVFSGLGHLLYLEDPRGVAREVEAFLIGEGQ
jgi:pimeloyl-ACP methyl ester carboxylesterase